MIILIAGATHTGKTRLAQKLLERYRISYLSIDHLKMGLIRSGQTDLTVYDDDALTQLLWPIVREIAKTAIENCQHMIVEGCYIPFDWREDLQERYLKEMDCRWLIMTPDYIRTHFGDIRKYACVVEQRLDDSGLDAEALILENQNNLEQCIRHGCDYILIDGAYGSPEMHFTHLEERL